MSTNGLFWGRKIIILLSLLILFGIVQIASAYIVDVNTPIGQKYVKLGGVGVVGNPTSVVTTIPNWGGKAQYQRFEQGTIVESVAFGSVYISNPIFDKWFTLTGKQTEDGQNLFDYIGVPIKDYSPPGVGVFQKGLIDGSYVVYGKMYDCYDKNKAVLGLPTSDESQIVGMTGKWKQTFQNGEIYYNATTGDPTFPAYEIHGPILTKWISLGGAGSLIGLPKSNVIRIDPMTDPTKGYVNTDGGWVSRFENGNIYDNIDAGTWAMNGELLRAYERNYGGPTGWLGFPATDQRSSFISSAIYNNLQGGVIVNFTDPTSIYSNKTHAFNKMDVYFQELDEWNVGWCATDTADPYGSFNVSTMNPDTVIFDQWIPGPPGGGNYGDDGVLTVDRHVDCGIPRGEMEVRVSVSAMDHWDIFPDLWCGTVIVTYKIDNLWGLYNNVDHISHGSDCNCAGCTDYEWMNAKFSGNPSFPVTITDPRKEFNGKLYWSFDNFGTEVLTPHQYGETFVGVAPEEDFWKPANWLDFLYYEILYKGLAAGGNCFGISLESGFALHGTSRYVEPIWQYYPDTACGAELTASSYPGANDLINEINVIHGRQIGGEEILWIINQMFVGQTHNPTAVYGLSQQAYDLGDNPTISISTGYVMQGGHNVMPYNWTENETTGHLIMYIADSNYPTGCDPADHSVPNPGFGNTYIEIDPIANTWVHSNRSEYSGDEWLGGRMIYFPYHIMSDRPRTPMGDIWNLLTDGSIFLCGSTGDTAQISDDTGHTYYQTGISGPPTRWDQIQPVSSGGIPDLARIGLSDDRLGPGPQLYFSKGTGSTYHWSMVPMTGVPTDTPYQWLVNTGTFSANMVIPGTPDKADCITYSQMGTVNQALSLYIPANGQIKEVACWTMSGGVKGRWSTLSHLNMVPNQAIEIKLQNGGYHLKFQNSGPATTANLVVCSDPGATPVNVGLITIPSGASDFAFDAPNTTLTYTGGQPNSTGWLLTPITVTLQSVDYSGTGIAYKEYSFDGVTWTTYTAPFDYCRSGITRIYYRAKDNAGNQEIMKSHEFRFGTPKISAFVPNLGVRGRAAFRFVVSGSDFRDGATVSLTRTGATTIQATSNSVAPANNYITCMLQIPSNAPPGARDVVVTNPGGINITKGKFTVM